MCRKSFTSATFVRYLLTGKTVRFHSASMDLLKEQIAVGKGFSAYIPVIKYIFC